MKRPLRKVISARLKRLSRRQGQPTLDKAQRGLAIASRWRESASTSTGKDMGHNISYRHRGSTYEIEKPTTKTKSSFHRRKEATSRISIRGSHRTPRSQRRWEQEAQEVDRHRMRALQKHLLLRSLEEVVDFLQ